MNASEWLRLLSAATDDVRVRVSAVLAEEEARKVVGTGAAGDQTILADKAAEDVLLEAIGKVPGVRVLSEEAGMAGAPEGRTLAIVDPLDGSSNFERGIPFYCTSVAIAEGGGDVVAGVVRDLVSGDVYAAAKGEGATKNGVGLRTSALEEPSGAVVGVDISRSPPGLVEKLAPLVRGVKRQTHLGANALELCYLADGRLDAFVDLRGAIRVTDFAAAKLITEEAGARVTGPGGEKLALSYDLEHRFSFVASANRALHERILKLCSS